MKYKLSFEVNLDIDDFLSKEQQEKKEEPTNNNWDEFLKDSLVSVFNTIYVNMLQKQQKAMVECIKKENDRDWEDIKYLYEIDCSITEQLCKTLNISIVDESID